MTDNNNNEIIYERSPYQVIVDKAGEQYVVLNTQTGIFEMEEKVLGRCLHFAREGAEFVDAFLKEEEEEGQISVFPASSLQ